MSVRLHTLGGFSLHLDGAAQPERSGQPVRSALLILLALDREVSRESAMALLWPESDDDRARQALRQTLYLLRRDLGDDWLDATHDQLLATAALECDAHELVDAAQRDGHERVTELYRGTFLAGVHLVESHPFQLWCDQWAGRLERLHRQSRRAVIDARVGEGDLSGALESAREWLELDPLEDEAQHRVIELLSRLGRGDEAVREYTAFEALLAQEGLEPLEQTQELVAEIRKGGRGVPPLREAPAGVQAPTAPSGEAAPPREAASPFEAPRPWAGRRWSVLVVLLVLALLAAGGAVVLPLVGGRGSASALEPERVMVFPLVNETGDTALDDIGILTADWITHAVAHMGPLQAVPFLDVRQMLGAGVQPEEAAVHRRAGTLVSGRYFRTGDSLELHVRITDLREGELWHALDPVRIDATSPEDGLRELRDRVAGSLGVRFTPASALPDPAALDPPTYPAFRAHMEAAAYISRLDWAGALPHMQRATELDTTFYRARIGLATAHRNLGRPGIADSMLRALEPHRERFSPYERLLFRGMRASLDGDVEQQLALVRIAARIDPGGTAHYISAGVALRAGRPREAIDLYSTLDPQCPWAPGWLGAWSSWVAAFHLLGDHERELREARRARSLHPDRIQALFFELRALVGLGRTDAVRERLAEANHMAPRGSWDEGRLLRLIAGELRAHGQPDAAEEVVTRAVRWYAGRPAEERSSLRHRLGYLKALLLSDRLSEAEQVLTDLRTAHPDRLDVLGITGVLAARQGDRTRAHEASSQLVARRGPYQNGAVDYWRAAIAAWSGEEARALTLLRRAFEQGRGRGNQLHPDPFLEPLWSLPAFRTAVAEDR